MRYSGWVVQSFGVNSPLPVNPLFLLTRLVAFALTALLVSPADLDVLALAAIPIAVWTAVTTRWFPAGQKYAFLLAAALWGGVATALAVNGMGTLSVLLALALAVFDGSGYKYLACRR